MRRKDRERDRAFALSVVDRCEYGVLAMTGPDGMPYCVPLSMARDGEDIIFHCARVGQKTDFLRTSASVCISFVTDTEIMEEEYVTAYASAVVLGTAAEVTDEEEKMDSMRIFCQKLTPGAMDGFERTMREAMERTAVWRVRMTEVTGKEKPGNPKRG